MLANRMHKICIAGAGLTGAVTSSIIRERAGQNVQIELWDKSRGSGGRMGTSRNPANGKSSVDLGAEYISATPDYFSSHKRYYDELLENHILKPLKGMIAGPDKHKEGSSHFIPPKGMGQIVKHFIEKSDAKKHFGERISEVTLKDNKWCIQSESGKSDLYDCLILTMPVPQILELAGDIQVFLGNQKEVKEKLENVKYSSRFALGLFYEPGTKIDVPWVAKYFAGDDCIVFISMDDKKRNIEADEVGPTVAIHTSVPFGLRHLEEDKETVCKDIVLPKAKQLVPEIPEPTVIKSHKWRYSQVFKAYEGTPGAVLLHNDPPLILAGDAFVHSNFDGCIESAQAVISLLDQHSKL